MIPPVRYLGCILISIVLGGLGYTLLQIGSPALGATILFYAGLFLGVHSERFRHEALRPTENPDPAPAIPPPFSTSPTSGTYHPRRGMTIESELELDLHFCQMALDRGDVRAIDREQDRILSTPERINLLVMEVRRLRRALKERTP